MEILFEKIERVLNYENTLNTWRSNFNSIEFKEASELNKALFGMEFNKSKNCDCVTDFFSLLKYKISKNKIVEIMEKEFFIKKGKVIMNNNFAQAVTSGSSDADCIKLLQLNEKFISSFEKVPSNWKEIVFGKAKAKQVEEIVENKEAEKVSEESTETSPIKKQYKKRK